MFKQRHKWRQWVFKTIITTLIIKIYNVKNYFINKPDY